MSALNRQTVKSSRRATTLPALEPVFSFEELEVYQAARAFRQRTNKLAATLPACEKYRLKDQMPRAALTITNAIAEGHGRYTFKDRNHYTYVARGSLQELVDDINECHDRSYAKPEHLADLKQDAFRLLQLIDGWARYLAAQHKKLLTLKRRRPTTNQQPNDSTT